MVPVRKRARGRMSGEIGPQPPLLRRSGPASAHRAAIRIEGDEMPHSDVEAVPPFALVAGRAAEVREVTRRARRLVFVVTGSRVCQRFHASPRTVVGGAEADQRPSFVLEIAEG